MATKGRVRRAFAGGNTAIGFCSYFEEVYSPDSKRVVLLKGGPGTGKSSLMQWLGEELVGRGHDVEYFHCSSDPSSLDAISVPRLQAAVIDATAPHSIDPKYPGAVDEIVNLGTLWDEDPIRASKSRIISTQTAMTQSYQRSYRLLATAKLIHDDIKVAHQDRLDYGKANAFASSTIGSIFGHRPVSSDVGRARHLFASAITPEGPVNHLHNLVDGLPHKYIITGAPGTGKATLVQKVVQAAVEKGFFVEAFHCALDPTRYEHAIIPALGCAVVSSTPPHVYEAVGATVVNMDLCRHPAAVTANAALVEEHTRIFWYLFNRAVGFLAQAKGLHDQLEQYYVPHVDFEQMELLRTNLLAQLLATDSR